MTRTFLFFILLPLLLSCTKTDRSQYNAPCTDSCTTLQGRFITGNNEGVANIPYEIRSESRSTLGMGPTVIRLIASGKTDNNGFYSSTFALQPREYGATRNATLLIKFPFDKNRFLLIDWYEMFGSQESLDPLSRKDTTVTADIYFTSKGKLKVRLENFVPLQTNDEFFVVTTCWAGMDRQQRTGARLQAAQTTTEGVIDACGNEQTTVLIGKRKNGVYTTTTSTIYTPTGQEVAATYSF